MPIGERGPWSVPNEVGKFPSSNSPSWRLWMLRFLHTADQRKWNYQTCCRELSESLEGDAFNAFLEAKLSAEVEMDHPSVSDVLSRISEVIGRTQMEITEERLLGELRQRDDESVFEFARKVGAVKTFALKERCNESWVSICVSGLADECLQQIVEQPERISAIVRLLEHQDDLESQLNLFWSKMHRIRFLVLGKAL